jgi:hypothetical protein
MKNYLFVALFITITIFSSAQAKKRKATLIFKNGTELSCFARISGENIRYTKDNVKDAEIMVNEKELKGINIWMNDRLIELVYKSEDGKDNTKLMELTNNGKMKLYRIQDAYEKNIGFDFNKNLFEGKSANTVYYLESKNNKDQVIRVANKFEPFAKEYFTDCKLLVDKIGNDNFRKKDMIKIVIFYNENCSK